MQTEINILKHSSIKNRKELAALRGEFQDYKAQVEEARGKLAKDDVIEALRTSQTTLFMQVTDMTADVQSAVSGIDEVRYGTLKTIEKMQSEIDVLESSLIEDEGEAQDPGQSPKEISARLDALEGALGILKTQVAALSVSGIAAADSESAPQSIYKKAYKQFEARSFTEAREQMRAFLAQYPRHELAGNALFWIGETHFNQKRYDNAILSYQDVIEKYPENRKVPAAHLKQAYSFIKLGENVAARGILKTLLERHPDSDVAKFAEKKLKELE